MRTLRFKLLSWSLVTLVGITPVHGQFERPSLADSFRLGTGGGVLCQVQVRSQDPAISDIFDRAWSIVCRDAARPIGKLYALRGDRATALKRLADARQSDVKCGTAGTQTIDDIGLTDTLSCQLISGAVGYKVISAPRGTVLWVAEGLTGYESALTLGLRTVITDQIVSGQISVATTSVDDPAAFARVQAGTLDPDQALAEGYRRNNSGNYAEAAEFFDTLQQRADTGNNDRDRIGEYLINRALQKSNLGEFGEADALIAEARRLPSVDRVQTRLRRNFEVMHLINQQRYTAALVRIDQPVTPRESVTRNDNGIIEIGTQIAAEINSGIPVNARLGATESSALTPDERCIFLDAQALQLRGTLLRLQGNASEARVTLARADADVSKVRDGRVVSVIRLRSQILAEIALALEAGGDKAAAETKMRSALTLLETRYPQTVAVNGARARLAALLARNGKTAEAMAEYRTVVQSAAQNRSSTTGLGNLLSPYFSLLADRIPTNSALVDDMFLASQTLVRPGVADTQAILARELSEGTGEAARLFRQSRTLDRDVERSRIEMANLMALPTQTAATQAAIAVLNTDLETFGNEQTITQAKLAQFPQYRAIATTAISLAEAKAALRPGEAYFKLTVVGRSVFGLYFDQTSATGYKVGLAAAELERDVDALRDTIATNENGVTTTYPFNVDLARALYTNLMGPISAQLLAAKHVIFEPDGAMLRLPANLLLTADTGIAGYKTRAAQPSGDEYDFTGLAWLGRGRALSTAVAVKAFRDARQSPASRAGKQYLGFGQNAPLPSAFRTASTISIPPGDPRDCDWPPAQWNAPVSAAELRTAQSIVGADQSLIVTGAAFSDSDLIARTDLANYRILHFATHGLVSAPNARCPARPALVTSFGSPASDGLLTFREIYDLKIDADLVILSACDTAGKASISATREAGVTSGGGSAMDGLVRAFIGAGGRSVLASHWPAPDDFKATERLISGLFRANIGVSVGDAMASAQRVLMDDPVTSHPYYWSGFAIVGDGGQAMLTPR